MATVKQQSYVRGSYLPFEEDDYHEFKGHREIAPEDTPPWAFRHPSEAQTRQAISRNLNAFLNTSRGGIVYCGVDDRGRVLGMHLTRYQKDHVLLSVRDLLMRYRPAVPSNRHRVTFVPVVSKTDVDNPPTEFAYDANRRSKQHLVATSHYCWCDADARARSVSGVIPLSYVIEIEILPWADRDNTLHPFYLTESGRCYVRRQASIVPLSAADCIRVTRHEAAALLRRQSKQVALASQQDVAAVQARLDSGGLWSASRPACSCPSGSDGPQPPAGESAEGAVQVESERGGEKRKNREEHGAVSASHAEARDAAVPQGSSSSEELARSCAGGDGLAQSSSTDSVLAQDQSSSTDTELAHGSEKLSHSSSTDSGLSLTSCDTGLVRNPVFNVTKKGSSSSESEATSHPDFTSVTTNTDPTPSEPSQSPELASGIQAVSELLGMVLPSSIPSPPTSQSLVDSTATAMASEAGVAVSDSGRPPSSGARSGAGPGGSESDASLSLAGAAGDVTLSGMGGNGSDISHLVPEFAPDRSLMDLGASETDLGASETDLGTSGTDLGTSGTDLGTSGTDLGTSGTDLGTSETDLDTIKDAIKFGADVVDLAESETDYCVAESNLGTSEVNASADDTDLGTSEVDLHAKGTSDLDASEAGFGIDTADTSLLELDTVPESAVPQLGSTRSFAPLPVPTSMARFVVTAESDSALTTEAESDYGAASEGRLSAISDPASDLVPAQRRRISLQLKKLGLGQASPPPRSVVPGTWKFPQGFRGRGKALEAAKKLPEVVGKVPEVEEKASEPIGEVINFESEVSEDVRKVSEDVRKVPEDVREVLDVEADVLEARDKILEVTGKLGTLMLGEDPADDHELDSDDSEDSW